MTKKVRRLFSESFKKEKVEQIESGQIAVHKLSICWSWETLLFTGG
jgi:hypothetical protein